MNEISIQTLREKKKALRSDIAAALRNFTPLQRDAASKRIREQLHQVDQWAAADIIALFYPLPDEPDLLDVGFGGVWTSPKQRFAFPVVQSDGALLFREATNPQDFARGSFGTQEPNPTCRTVALDEINLFVIPGRAFDNLGQRLGRGGGHYDRTLATVDTGKIIGVAFDTQLVDEPIPAEPHDIRVGAVLIPGGCVSVSQ